VAPSDEISASSLLQKIRIFQ